MVIEAMKLKNTYSLDNRGIDFAMTALFLVILTDQCREKCNRFPAFTGLAATVVCGLFFSLENVLIPSMVLMLVLLLLLCGKLAKKETEA